MSRRRKCHIRWQQENVRAVRMSWMKNTKKRKRTFMRTVTKTNVIIM